MNAYGINRPCYPSVCEVMQAKKIFTQYIQQHAHEAQATPGSINYTSPEVIVSCALAGVREAGRLYQQQKTPQHLNRCISSEVWRALLFLPSE